ncbi:MAG: hypothetical protein HQL57_10345 [Magnetococcales bacterium]|nr:hypothetical protein [Magnetococcales bacterium]
MSQERGESLAALAEAQVVAGHMDPDRLKAMGKLILHDGNIDDREIALLKGMIAKTRVGTERPVRRAEIEFLFALNEGTIGGRHEEVWRAFFIEAVAAHILDDPASPGLVNEEEANWLIAMVEKDGRYDPNEIALLKHLQATASEIPMSIRFRLGMIIATTA